MAVAACVLGGAAFVLAATLVPAESDEMVEGGDAVTVDDGGPGMPASNPRVKSMLTGHPNEFVTVCVAGCPGKPAIVQVLPKPIERRTSAMRTTAGGLSANAAIDSDAVKCVAGCAGRPGEVVQRLPGLPAPKAPAPDPSKEGNEPLDVVP
jgi:hypothetical protein